ncbi:MAG: PLP-dependent aminotransferase family protein [Candidatus Dormiibacterota bacterium]
MPRSRTTSPDRRSGEGASVDLFMELGDARRRRGLERQLRTGVQSGRLAPGLLLPSSRALARDLGISRGAVVEAYDQLAAEGYLRTRQGSGTRVAARPAPSPSPALAPLAPTAAQVDLQPGSPDLTTFPREQWITALRRALRSAPAGRFGYGDPRGDLDVRETLARYVGRARGVVASAETIVVVDGFLRGLNLWASVARRQGTRHVGVEDPSLPLHREVLRSAGLEVHPIPVDELGIDVERLAATPATAVLVTPAHQFPRGVPLAPRRRAALMRWAESRHAQIVEDDYDGEFRYDRTPVGALQGLDPSRIVYGGTTSKSLAPGVRLAWLAVLPRLLADLCAERLLAERQPPALDQLALGELIDSAVYDRHVRRMRATYRRRRDRLVALLRERVPAVEVSGIAAGLHAVVRLPPGTDEARVVSALAGRSIAVDGEGRFRAGASGPPALVVGYGTPPEHAVDGALVTFVDALAETLRRS